MEQKNHQAGGIKALDVAIQIEDQDNMLVSSILEEMQRKPSAQCSIYRVPSKLRSKSDNDTYEPRIVSIGPYHHGKECFKTIEEHKKWYLHDLISRRATISSTLKDFVQAMRGLEVCVRECYAEPISLSSNEFVKMMVFDGCFILELFYKYSERSAMQGEEGEIEYDNEDEDSREDKDDDEEIGKQSNNISDLILGTTWMIYSLRKDLVLLENQVPFIVLEKLFDLTKDPKQKGHSLHEHITTFFNPILPTVKSVKRDKHIKGTHILDILRNHLLPSHKQMDIGVYPYWEYSQSASDLWEFGVKFKKKESVDGLLDITFTDEGILEIPPFFFGESWTVLLPNLIALEQCRRDYTDQITSYVILIDSLINNQNDVKLLRRNGIIDGLFHEDEQVAVAINNLFKGAVVDKFHYDGLCSRINAYCRTDWHKWRATLKRDYFHTPWAILSFTAAVILLLLTLAQTLFSILSYAEPKK